MYCVETNAHDNDEEEGIALISLWLWLKKKKRKKKNTTLGFNHEHINLRNHIIFSFLTFEFQERYDMFGNFSLSKAYSLILHFFGTFSSPPLFIYPSLCLLSSTSLSFSLTHTHPASSLCFSLFPSVFGL